MDNRDDEIEGALTGALAVLAALMRAIELNGAAVAMNQKAFNWGRLAAVDPARVREAAGLKTAAANPVATLNAEPLDDRALSFLRLRGEEAGEMAHALAVVESTRCGGLFEGQGDPLVYRGEVPHPVFMLDRPVDQRLQLAGRGVERVDDHEHRRG